MSNIVKAFNRWKSNRQSINELSRLNSRELADIGITAGDIRRLAREHAISEYA